MTHTKVLSLARLIARCTALRRGKKRIVFTNGCFDLIHYGHVRYLELAKKQGDILIVGVNSDRSVRALKGTNRPIVKERERAALVAALACVDYVTIFQEDTPRRLIPAVKPDVLVKGSDWALKDLVGADFVTARGGRVLRIPLVRGRSSTGLIHAILKKYRLPARCTASNRRKP